jgi:hypothetical protein
VSTEKHERPENPWDQFDRIVVSRDFLRTDRAREAFDAAAKELRLLCVAAVQQTRDSPLQGGVPDLCARQGVTARRRSTASAIVGLIFGLMQVQGWTFG